jgi:hypothetical protein
MTTTLIAPNAKTATITANANAEETFGVPSDSDLLSITYLEQTAGDVDTNDDEGDDPYAPGFRNKYLTALEEETNRSPWEYDAVFHPKPAETTMVSEKESNTVAIPPYLLTTFGEVCNNFRKVNTASYRKIRSYIEACSSFVTAEREAKKWEAMFVKNGEIKACDYMRELKTQLAQVTGTVSNGMVSRYRKVGTAASILLDPAIEPYLPLSTETLYFLSCGPAGTDVTKEQLLTLIEKKTLHPKMSRNELKKAWCPPQQTPPRPHKKNGCDQTITLFFSSHDDIAKVVRAINNLALSKWYCAFSKDDTKEAVRALDGMSALISARIS